MSIDQNIEAKKPSVCRNTRCEHHRRGGGCKLFVGLNFVRCRQCVF